MAEIASTEASKVAALLEQCRQLHTSVLRLKEAATAQQTPIDIDHYLKSLASEMRGLERISTSTSLVRPNNPSNSREDKDEDKALKHKIRSRNLSFLQVVWDIARRCHNVVALNRTRKVGVVDIVANMGLLWIKIVTLDERKLLFEMARDGWNESDGESDAEGANLPLVQMVETLALEAKSSRVRYRRPELLVYFPNLEDEDKITIPVVKKLLASVRATGAAVHCGPGDILLRDSTLLASSTQGLDDLRHMLPQALPDLTPTVNIDCTILLALISDLSHFSLDEQSVYNKSLKWQVTEEHARPLLTSTLYPVLKGRKMITSHLAVQRMNEILDTLGLPDEKARAEICFQQNTFSATEYTPARLHEEFQKRSIHIVPPDLRLPIEVINSEIEFRNLPSEANLLHTELSEINYSVMTLGWSRNVTTVTSNRAVAKQVERILNSCPDEVRGPEMCVLNKARSLVGKEKRGSDEEKEFDGGMAE